MRIVSRVGIGKNPTSHHLDVTGSANFDSQVFFQNTAFFNAGVELGDTSADLISVNGRVDTDIEPSLNTDKNFGSPTLFWNNSYSKNLIIKNDGSIESDGTTVNIGTVSSTVINIGKVGTTVNLYGTVNKIQSTDTEVFDKLLTLNKNGLVSSAFGSGFEVEENAIITGYIKTSLDRNSWVLKSPNKSGIIALEPGSSAFTHKILSQASADRTWTLPDNTDTFVGTTNAQTVDNKTLNNTTTTGTFITNGTVTTNGNVTVNGNITINGTAIGVGFVPVGAVISTIPALTGAYSCTATTAADAFGYVRCNGQTIADITSPLNGRVIPNINNDTFLMGNITSNSAGGSNTHSHTVNQHTHSVPGHYHVWGSWWSTDNSNDIYNDNGDGGGNTYDDTYGYAARSEDAGWHSHGIQGVGNHQHEAANSYRREGIEDNDDRRNYFNKDDGPYTSPAGAHSHGMDGAGTHWHQVRRHRHWIKGRNTHNVGGPDGRNTMTSGNSDINTGTSTVSTLPRYITALYIMRVK